jgi:hypothetical protein
MKPLFVSHARPHFGGLGYRLSRAAQPCLLFPTPLHLVTGVHVIVTQNHFRDPQKGFLDTLHEHGRGNRRFCRSCLVFRVGLEARDKRAGTGRRGKAQGIETRHRWQGHARASIAQGGGGGHTAPHAQTIHKRVSESDKAVEDHKCTNTLRYRNARNNGWRPLAVLFATARVAAATALLGAATSLSHTRHLTNPPFSPRFPSAHVLST